MRNERVPKFYSGRGWREQHVSDHFAIPFDLHLYQLQQPCTMAQASSTVKCQLFMHYSVFRKSLYSLTGTFATALQNSTS